MHVRPHNIFTWMQSPSGRTTAFGQSANCPSHHHWRILCQAIPAQPLATAALIRAGLILTSIVTFLVVYLVICTCYENVNINLAEDEQIKETNHIALDLMKENSACQSLAPTPLLLG